jgi:hypothetical protein
MNQPYIGAMRLRAAARLPRSHHSRARFIAAPSPLPAAPYVAEMRFGERAVLPEMTRQTTCEEHGLLPGHLRGCGQWLPVVSRKARKLIRYGEPARGQLDAGRTPAHNHYVEVGAAIDRLEHPDWRRLLNEIASPMLSTKRQFSETPGAPKSLARLPTARSNVS